MLDLKFTIESDGEKILIIGQHLIVFEAKICYHSFLNVSIACFC